MDLSYSDYYHNLVIFQSIFNYENIISISTKFYITVYIDLHILHYITLHYIVYFLVLQYINNLVLVIL